MAFLLPECVIFSINFLAPMHIVLLTLLLLVFLTLLPLVVLTLLLFYFTSKSIFRVVRKVWKKLIRSDKRLVLWKCLRTKRTLVLVFLLLLFLMKLLNKIFSFISIQELIVWALRLKKIAFIYKKVSSYCNSSLEKWRPCFLPIFSRNCNISVLFGMFGA